MKRRNPGKLSDQFKRSKIEPGKSEDLSDVILESLQYADEAKVAARDMFDNMHFYEYVAGLWKKIAKASYYVPKEGHVCNWRGCKRTVVCARVIEINDAASTRELASTFASSDVDAVLEVGEEEQSPRHICFGPKACPIMSAGVGSALDLVVHRPGARELASVSCVSVCELSGKVHVCGLLCDSMSDADPLRGADTCSVTGWEGSVQHAVDIFWRPPGVAHSAEAGASSSSGGGGSVCNTRVAPEKPNFMEFAVANAAGMDSVNNLSYKNSVAKMFPGITRYSTRVPKNGAPPAPVTNNRTRYLKVALEKVAWRLSDVQFEYEDEANKERERKLRETLDQYNSKCEKQSLVLVASHVHHFVRQARMRGTPATSAAQLLRLPGLANRDMNRHVLHYAQSAVVFWSILRERVAAFRKDPDIINFNYFVDSFMDMLAEGFTVCTSDGVTEVILKKDVFLASHPFHPHKHPQWSKFFRSKLASMKKEIKTMVRNEVLSGVNPDRLRPDETLFDQLSEPCFVKLKNTSTAKKKK